MKRENLGHVGLLLVDYGFDEEDKVSDALGKLSEVVHALKELTQKHGADVTIGQLIETQQEEARTARKLTGSNPTDGSILQFKPRS